LFFFLQVIDAVYSATNYLLLRLQDESNNARQMLESIKPDFSAMAAAADKLHVSGVILTCKGGKS
jgi:hypothetical protein